MSETSGFQIDQPIIGYTDPNDEQLVTSPYGTSSLRSGGRTLGVPYVLVQSAVPVILPPSGQVNAAGQITLGTAVGNGTVTFGATTGSTTCTASAAAFVGSAVDNGKVITIQDGANLRYFTITAFSTTTVCTGTLSGGTLSTAGPWANTAWRLSVPLLTTYADSWVYLPVTAVTGVGAGLYYCQWVSTTVGSVKTTWVDPTVSAFTPSLQTGLTPAIGSGVDYATPTGSDIPLAKITLPGGAMGANGALRINGYVQYSNTATNKRNAGYLGGGSFYAGTRGAAYRDIYLSMVRNRGLQTKQSNFDTLGILGNYTSTPLSVDTSVDQTILFTGQCVTVPTDFVVLEGFTIEVLPSA
jgi:hypothetical protein